MSADRILNVIYLGRMSENFSPSGMSDVTRRKGDVWVSKREEVTWQFLERPPSG